MLSDVDEAEHVPAAVDGEEPADEKNICNDGLPEIIQPKYPKLPFEEVSKEVKLEEDLTKKKCEPGKDCPSMNKRKAKQFTKMG